MVLLSQLFAQCLFYYGTDFAMFQLQSSGILTYMCEVIVAITCYWNVCIYVYGPSNNTL